MLPLDSVPTYEYECPKCPRTFEIRQRISEPALSTCDICGGPIRRLLAPAPFILKGGGWYVTDYPSESRKKALSGESESKPATADAKPGSGDSGGASPGSSSSTGSGDGKGSGTGKSEAKASKTAD